MNQENDQAAAETKEKTAHRKKRDNNNDSLFICLDDNSYIDLNDSFVWNNKKLTDRQKKFIFFYSYPFNNNAKGNGAEAARKAGYSVSAAKIQASTSLMNKDIQKEKKNIDRQIAETITKTNLKERIVEIIEKKYKRTKINPLEYYNIEKVVTEEGQTFVNAEIKDKQQLTKEQQEQIIDVEYVTQRGIPHFRLPSKIEAENELLKIYKDLYDKDEAEKDGYEVETTAEIIKGNLQVKTKVIKSNSEIAELSDLKSEAAIDRVEEE